MQFQGFQLGETVDDRYEVLHKIGQGGFGVVYQARQIAIGRMVALKILLPEADTIDPQAVERFRREAVLISSLESPNTVTLIEFGQTADNLLYTVMEFAKGETLRGILAAEGVLEPKRVVHITKQVLNSLGEAHSRGIIHRDLKPANIMVGEYANQVDHVKVLDFGIAKILKSGDTQSTLALTGRLVGTPRYMAPEQLRGVNPTPAADLYAVGLIMFEMLTGQPVVTATDAMEQIEAQMREQSFTLPPDIAKCPSELAAVVNKALRKEPLERFQSGTSFCEALDRALRPPSTSTGVKHIIAATGADTASLPVSVMPRSESSGGSLLVWIIIAALFFVVAAGGFGLLLMVEDSGEGSGSSTETDSGTNNVPPGRDVGRITSTPDAGPIIPTARDAGQISTTTDVLASTPEVGGVPSVDLGQVVVAPDVGHIAAVDAGPAPSTDDVGPTVTVADATADEPVAVASADVQVAAVEDVGATAPTSVEVMVTADPDSADVYVDGERICTDTPCAVLVPADGTEVRLTVRARNYETYRSSSFGADDAPTFHVELDEEESIYIPPVGP